MEQFKLKEGLFIALEGCEGSGKTTISNIIKDKFPEFKFTREPGGTPESKKLREILVNDPKLDKNMVMSLLASSRLSALKNNVIPEIINKNVVITDRFELSTYAYQINCDDSHTHTLRYEQSIEQSNQIIVESLLGHKLKPFYIYLDIDPKISVTRKLSDCDDINEYDKLGLDFHNKVREGYLYWLTETKEFGNILDLRSITNDKSMYIEKAGNYNGVIIDAAQPYEDIHKDVLGVIQSLLVINSL